MCLFVLLYRKEDIWKNVLIKQISIPIDYHMVVNIWKEDIWKNVLIKQISIPIDW